MSYLFNIGCVVEHHKTNGTKDVYPCKNEVDCFYKGRSSNHSNSWVSASVCGGFVSYVFFTLVTSVNHRYKIP